MRSEDLTEGLTAFIEKRRAAVEGPLNGQSRRRRHGDQPGGDAGPLVEVLGLAVAR